MKGGCIFSNGYIHLSSSSVSGCGVVNIDGQAEGGGLYSGSGMRVESSTIANNTASGKQALGGGALIRRSAYFVASAISGNTAAAVTGATEAVISGGGLFTGCQARLNSVTVTNNQVRATNGKATGGGITAGGSVYLSFTAISNNVAVAPASSGGGVTALRDSFVYYSTIDHNQAVNNAGAEFRTAGTLSIRNSTISSNTATSGSSALFSSIPTFINNSTIAFNTAHGSDAGLYFYVGGTLDIESTIVSNNTSSSGTSYDMVSHSSVTGAHNLIMHSPLGTVPRDTLTGIDPLLEPLANNASFNPPLTHALAPTSPAIDRGSNTKNFNWDERWQPFSRVFGIAADIGAYEYDGTDTDTIFKNGFD